MKKTVLATTFVLSTFLLAGCSNTGDGTYESFEELTAAVESAGIDCEEDATNTIVDATGLARSCTDSYTMYRYQDPEQMRSAIDFIDQTRQGILVSYWVVGEDWYVLTGGEDAAKNLQSKIGGEIYQIGS